MDKEILKYIKKNSKIGYYDEIVEKDNRWEVFYNFSSIRENILNWYDFDKNSNVLEINAEYGAVTGLLCRKVKSVHSIVTNKEELMAIKKRHNKYNNLEVYIGLNLNSKQKYDYVIIYGLGEQKTNQIFKNEKLEIILNKIKKSLRKNGKLLIICDNKYGMQYWTGSTQYGNIPPFSSILGPSNGEEKLFSKEMLQDNITNAGFKNFKFFYIFPNYRIPNIIFSEDQFIDDSVVDRFFSHYHENDTVFFNQIQAYKELVNTSPNMFSFFVNSFLLECSNSVLSNKTKMVVFNNHRKPKYRLMTIVNSDKVCKKNANEESLYQLNIYKGNVQKAKKIIKNYIDEIDDGYVCSKYIDDCETIETLIKRKYENNNIKQVISHFNKFKKYLFSLSSYIEENDITIFDTLNVSIKKETKEQFHFLKDGFWDLTFRNCFYINKKYCFFDQEFCDLNVPAEFILFRCINNFCFDKREEFIELVSKEMEIYNYLELFYELEMKIQERLNLDRDVIQKTLFSGENNLYFNKINYLEQCINELNSKIEEQNKKIEEQNKIQESKTWRIFTLIRKAIDVFKK